MKLKIVWATIPLIAIIAVIFVVYGQSENSMIETKTTIESFNDPLKEIDLPQYSSIFRVFLYQKDAVIINDMPTAKTQQFELKPEMEDLYNDIALWDEPQNTIVIIPIFTISAYAQSGFYAYYDGVCDESCLTTNIFYDDQISYAGSQNAIKVLKLLGYQTISDIEISKSPEIILEYDKVILLHNEYVTQEVFDVITKHPKVLYLYPNALYAEISTDYDKGTITLIRGHNYPEFEIKNGFNWEYENTHPYEFDNDCLEWEFYEINNGLMLNCYPELIIHSDKKLLQFIKDF